MPIRRTLSRGYTPAFPVDKMQTYAIKSPISTHTRPGTCEEAGCKDWTNGFTTIVPAGSDKEALVRQVARGHSPDGVKRVPSELRDGDLIHFVYPAGTPCWKTLNHRVSLDRPEFYSVRGGDWRGSTGLIRRHDKPENWVDDFHGNQSRLKRKYGIG